MPTIEIEIPRLHPGQRRIVDEARRFNVLECGRRWGKTTFGEHVAIESTIGKELIGWFAPTHKLMDRSWARISHTLQPITKRIDRMHFRIELMTGGAIDFWSADHPDSGRGRKYHKAIIDEAGIVRDLEDVWNGTIRPTLTDFRGKAWFLGTPKGRRYFHELFARGQSDNPDWKSWRLATVDNPHIDPEEVAAAKRDMPEQAFAQEYLGIPADDGGNPFGIARIGACLAPLSTATPVAFGVDLAKSHDWCVVCGLDKDGNVCVLERWQGDWGQTRSRILALVNGWPTLVDSTGVGDPIVEDLHRVRGNINGFRFSSTSKQQIMEGLAAAIHQQAVRFPDGWLRTELDSFEYEYTRTGVRYCLVPETRVITADLRWVDIGSVKAGDSLLAFDENLLPGKRNRRWQYSVVTEATTVNRPCYCLDLDDGTEIIASDNHLWLVDTGVGGLQWRNTTQLRAVHTSSKSLRFSPSRLVRALSTWQSEQSYEAGYLAGVLDGEGFLSQTKRTDRLDQHGLRIGFAQRENAVAAKARDCMKQFGFRWTEQSGGGTHKDVTSFGITGRLPEVLRMLGQVRPARLLGSLDANKMGSVYKISTPSVIKKTFIGTRKVCAVSTTTKTLIAEGLLSHNCAPQGLHDDGVCALALAWHHFQAGRSQWCGVVQVPDDTDDDE